MTNHLVIVRRGGRGIYPVIARSGGRGIYPVIARSKSDAAIQKSFITLR